MEKNIGIDAYRTITQFDEPLFQWLKTLPIQSGQDIEIIVLPIKRQKHKKIEKKENTAIMIDTLLDEEKWYQLSQNKLSASYSENEPEYSLSQVKEPNADYEGG